MQSSANILFCSDFPCKQDIRFGKMMTLDLYSKAFPAAQ